MPFDVSVLNALSMSVQSLEPRPSTAFQPGTSFPARQSARATSWASLYHLAMSLPFIRYWPSSSFVRSFGSVPTRKASSTFFSARALHLPLALQYLHVFGAGANSPSPLMASAARSLTNSPNCSISSRVHSHSDMPSGSRGCTMDSLTVLNV